MCNNLKLFLPIPSVQLLIKRGCSLSLKSPRGEYPLHLAVRRYDANLVQILLSNRADVTSIDSLGRTALHLACELNSLGNHQIYMLSIFR